jgi:hypothetical protein
MHNKRNTTPTVICSMIIVLFMILFFSCHKDDDKGIGPAISFRVDTGYVFKDDTVLIGKTFNVGIIAEKGDANITNFIIKVSNDSTVTYLDTGLNAASLNISETIIKGIAPKDTWTFIVRDKSGNQSEISFNIYADSSSLFGPIITIPSIILGAQNNTTIGSFLYIKNNLVYSLYQAYAIQDSIEICYYYDFLQGENNVIASPGANIDASVYTGTYGLANWTVKNETRYFLTAFTDNDFANLNNDSLLIATYTPNVTSFKRKAKNLVAGNIYAFHTAKNKLGLFEVLNVNGTDAGTVEIKIKMQPY